VRPCGAAKAASATNKEKGPTRPAPRFHLFGRQAPRGKKRMRKSPIVSLGTAQVRPSEPIRLSEENTSRPVSRVLSEGLPLRDGHSSGTPIAGRLKQPTRVASLKTDLASRAWRARPATPIWFCSRWGLPCRCRYRPRGALLPHPFTLTSAQRPWRFAFCGTVPGVAPGGR